MKKFLILLCAFIFFSTNTVGALSSEQKRVIQSGSTYFNVVPTEICKATSTGTQSPVISTSLPSGAQVYMLGDSITNMSSKKYRDAFSTKGITAYINAVGGRSWTYPGSGDNGSYTSEAGGAQTGKKAIEADTDAIKSSDGIIIALGSNGGLAANPIEEMITAIKPKLKNLGIPIWWVNTAASDTNKYPGVSVFGEFNKTLQEQYTALGFTIINWYGAVVPGGDPTVPPTSTVQDPYDYLSSDGLHPTSAGVEALVNLVVQQVSYNDSTAAAPQQASGCSCAVDNNNTTVGTTEENYQNTWNYFVTEKKLSPEAAAGLMGNLEAESGINPQNVQNDAKDTSGSPIPDGPEIPIDLIRGKYGYGIAQWTSAGRQQGLIDFAKKPPARSTGDLGLQLDYLWEELTTRYAGVLSKLQEIGVTLDTASDEVVLHFEAPASVLPNAGEQSKQTTLIARRDKSAKIFNTYSGLPAGSFKASSCTPGGAIDTADNDTTNVPCAADTVDQGPIDAYNEGKPAKIRACKTYGGVVNSQISENAKNMMAAATAAGVNLTIGLAFRTMDGQISIYNSWCSTAGKTPTPPPYPKASINDYVSCPGGAPPGYSNHQMGLAIDFQGIPQSYSSAVNNPAFIWLTENAGKYGFYEWGKGNRDAAGYEAWHWSVDGG